MNRIPFQKYRLNLDVHYLGDRCDLKKCVPWCHRKQNPFDLGHSGSGHKKDPLSLGQGISCSMPVTDTASMPDDCFG